MTVHDAYAILELAATATDDQLDRAYEQLMVVWDPDRFAGQPDLHEKARTNAHRIQEAYITIKEDRHARRVSKAMYPGSAFEVGRLPREVDWEKYARPLDFVKCETCGRKMEDESQFYFSRNPQIRGWCKGCWDAAKRRERLGDSALTWGIGAGVVITFFGWLLAGETGAGVGVIFGFGAMCLGLLISKIVEGELNRNRACLEAQPLEYWDSFHLDGPVPEWPGRDIRHRIGRPR